MPFISTGASTARPRTEASKCAFIGIRRDWLAVVALAALGCSRKLCPSGASGDGRSSSKLSNATPPPISACRLSTSNWTPRGPRSSDMPDAFQNCDELCTKL